MSSAYGKIDRPKTFDSSKLDELLPIEYTLKNNKLVSVHSLTKLFKHSEDDAKLMSYLRSLLNEEIQAGNSYPQKTVLNPSEFENYFLSGDVFVVLNGGKTSSNDFHSNLEENILGTFYIKPNFPGRCSHICNGGFVTSRIHRNQGVGKSMALAFIAIAPVLGYKASMFNLVFENNIASVRLWRSAGFQEIGRLPNAGYLVKRKDTSTEDNNQAEEEEEFVDALMFYYQFT